MFLYMARHRDPTQYGRSPRFQHSRGDPGCVLSHHMSVVVVVSRHVDILILGGVQRQSTSKKTVVNLFTDICDGADCVVRSISCEVEDGSQQLQLNVTQVFRQGK